MICRTLALLAAVLGLSLCGVAAPPGAHAQTAIMTFHTDMARTGWNKTETVLTQAVVGGAATAAGTFGLRATVALDGQVNAQPLVVPNIRIPGDPNPAKHDVVYVATEANTVYAIDPTRGTVLRSRNFGTPVPPTLGCGTPTAGVGIMSTPVIDQVRGKMYLIASTQGASGPVYTLHAMSLTTLADTVPSIVVAATQTLTNGTTYSFDAAHSRQRPALLEYGNAIYAGFGALCDFYPNLARGWVMGWQADSLQPLRKTASGIPIAELTSRNSTSPESHFLGSVWMSGSGPAADDSGIYFITGNSDTTGTTYDGVNNIPNTVVKLSASTGAVLDLFTPQNQSYLDQTDQDFSSGGIMLLPSLGAKVAPLATAAGKYGQMYLLNRHDLGGYTPTGTERVLAQVAIGKCWCVESFFQSDVPAVVSSGGHQIIVWQVQTSPAPGLSQIGQSQVLNNNGGMFTTISSNGASDPIIWAVLRPTSTASQEVTLMAFAGMPPAGTTQLKQLFSAPAGPWPVGNINASVMPTVANGRVYLATQKQLAIFGIGTGTSP